MLSASSCTKMNLPQPIVVFFCCFWSPTQRLTWKTIENEPSPISVFDFKTHLLRYNDRVDEEKMKGASRYANQHVYFRSLLSTSRKKTSMSHNDLNLNCSLKKNLSRQFPRRLHPFPLRDRNWVVCGHTWRLLSLILFCSLKHIHRDDNVTTAHLMTFSIWSFCNGQEVSAVKKIISSPILIWA